MEKSEKVEEYLYKYGKLVFYRIAIIIHVGLAIFSFIVAYTGDVIDGPAHSDMFDSYFIATERFLKDPNTLYEIHYCPFKYLPQSLGLFIPLFYIEKIIPFSSVAISIILQLMVNLGIILLIKKMVKKNHIQISKYPSLVYLILSFYLIAMFHTIEYSLSQVDIYVNFFIVLSIYYFLEGKEHVGYFWFSCSLIFKLTPVFVLPFLLLRKFKFKEALKQIKSFFSLDFKARHGLNVKQALKNIMFLVIPLIPSIIIFLIYPALIKSFININIVAPSDYMTCEGQNCLNMFFTGVAIGSLSKALYVLFGMDLLITFLIVAAICYTIVLYWIRRFKPGIVETLFLGLMAAFIFIPDFIKVHNTFLSGIFAVLALKKKLNWKYVLWFFFLSWFFLLWYLPPYTAFFYVATFACYIIFHNRIVPENPQLVQESFDKYGKQMEKNERQA
ncbi:MAG: hypothetical protein ACFFCS_14500 [Candidatus Hodarchaeota archaeon]